MDLDDRFLPALPRPLVQAAALRLRLHLRDVHADHAHLEELLDRLADLRLVRLGVDAEGVLLLVDQAVALLRDHRRDQDLAGGQAHSDPSSAGVAADPAPARARSPASAASETSSERAQTTAATSSSDGATTATFSRFLN